MRISGTEPSSVILSRKLTSYLHLNLLRRGQIVALDWLEKIVCLKHYMYDIA